MKKIILLLNLILISGFIFAQSMSDIASIKVDNLSDAQVERMIKQAESTGMNEQQLIAMARERGMPAQEVSKLQTRINAIRSGRMSSGNNTANTQNQGRQVEGMEMNDVFEESRNQDPFRDLTPNQKKIFGYTLFHNRELNFNPSLNIPTPQNYTIGGGDQLLIDVYGASQQSYDLKVSPEGRILVPNVGPIQVGGSTIASATARIKSALTQIYSGLGGGNPNTFMELRLGNIRTVSIAMAGELNKPGNYTLPAFASPFNALFAAGGPNENGSFRHIQVFRDSKLLMEIDVYEFLIKGENTNNITLRDNDLIIVLPVRARVELTGPVRREGLFEVKSGETVENLIAFAGGFKSEAYKERLTVTRKTGTELKVEDIDATNFQTFIPQDGDFFRVGQILNRFENRVQVSGALMRPGIFALQEGMTVTQLIAKAEGLREDAFLNRATLYRTKADFSLEVLPVDIKAVVNGEAEDVILRREDVLNIPSIYDIREEYYVKISGEVNKPGAFAYGENMKVADIVLKAGGFKESASASQIEIARRVKNDVSGKLAEIIRIDIDKDLRINGANADIVLQPFDHVIIRRSPGFQREKLVRVEGEVFYPGEYALANANERISDVLKRAGGLNQFAYAKGATLIRRNEFFTAPSENDIKTQNLTSVKGNIARDSLDRTEFDKILLDRIDQKIQEKGGDQANKKGGLMADDFRKETIEEIVEGDSTEEFVIRTKEMVGIDLVAILNNPGGKNDLILQEGDVLSIPKELQTVRMRGEVLYPTTARYRDNTGFKGYVSRAGGFTEKSRKSRSYVVYANGDVQRTRKVLFFNFYPHIEPGAEIIVPRKPEREPLSPQAWIGLGTSLATLALIVNNLLN
ncbi:protein involved in polysaccharide export, contains SLBB domain of the beta-grasp fold [Belliella buryatensis]|uniref:Protein involved in polysaccharide export, contains SLBB domain of the beta-grasp fold n=1 Tax=Belliella buryatensis TaxID=1500549 RepID=A0A239CS71_9BACT|nr:SLBB domain-containing protein [Belliella buryatensis]SNS23015.1 protein involved in polysaccharide export, contains SLBB domain of the beta-grasp fold [Belliella buryatensis]